MLNFANDKKSNYSVHGVKLGCLAYLCIISCKYYRNNNNRLMNSKPTKATICALATLLLGGATTCHAQDDNELRLLPSNYIGINGGFGWLSNEIVTEDGSKINKKPKGYDLGLEYAHLWQLKNSRKPLYMGFAVNVMRNYADIEPLSMADGACSTTSLPISTWERDGR